MHQPPDRLHNRKALTARRRTLRNAATPAEKALWKRLQKSQLKGRKFRRQHSIGPYIIYFYCPAEKLAVELDGAPHDDPFRRDYDVEREAFLKEQGVRVVRFENREVFEDPSRVTEAIAWHLHG